jgi:Protein of unknown function (DUF2778)
VWTYNQLTGALIHDGQLAGFGYSGMGAGKNDPAMQAIHDIGPIPRGQWRIGPPYDSATHGPHVMALTPDSATETFGRSGFLIHADSVSHPGQASCGCIVLSNALRHQISASGDRFLEVI